MQPEWKRHCEPGVGERMADAMRLHQTVLTMDELWAGRWAAISIADGSSDRTAYDSHEAAVKAATNRPTRHFYPRIVPEPMSPRVCDLMIWYVRNCYNNGWREDPAWQLWIPGRLEDIATRTGGRTS